MIRGAPSPDVAIVGGGIVGTAAAAFLAAAGARVTLFERETIAAAASGRNSGVIQHPFDPVLVGLYRESLASYRALAEASAGTFSLPAEPAGLLAVGFDESRAAELARVWAAAYPETRPAVIAGSALHDLEPALARDVVACRIEIGYPVVPEAATRAFAAQAAASGADVRIGRDVRLAVQDGIVAGVDADGEVTAAASVVVAAGPWAPAIVDPSGAWRPIHSVWGVVAHIRLARPPWHVLEEIAIDIEPGSDAGHVGAGEVDFSLVTAHGESSLGSTFLVREPDPAQYAARLLESGARFIPEIGATQILGLRCCARPQSRDGRPLVGAIPGLEGAFIAAGNGPWGISTGPATARLIADLVLGRDAGIPAALDPGRFGGLG